MAFPFSFCRIPPGGLPLKLPTVLHRSRAKYDRLAKAITLGTWTGLLLLDLFLFYIAGEEGLVVFLAVLGLTLGILLGTFLFSPRSFELTLSGIAVRRVLMSFEIPYDEISEAERVRWKWRGVRLSASGGLHGFFGLYYFKDVGKVWVYVTDRSRMVLLKTKSGTQYMLSPEDPEAFLEKLQAVVKRVKA